MFKRFLFVSFTSRHDRPYFDPSVRYRCFNFANELIRRGHSATVMSQQNFEKTYSSLPDYDAYIFHRPHLTPTLSNFLINAEHDQLIVADFDDFIFDVRYADMTPMVRVRGEKSAAAKLYISKNHDAASLIKNFTLSTAPLKNHIEDIFPESNAIVLSNSIDPGFIGLSRIARQNNPVEKRPYALGYFSGTATHDKDFALIAPLIFDRLKKSGERILLVGPLKIPESLEALGDQVVTHPLVSFHELAQTMAQCATVLAPLENTMFTLSKSGLKFFEAALAGCDVIATPIPDIDRFDSPLLHKCTTLDDWADALNKDTLKDPIAREKEISRIEELISVGPQIDHWFETFMSKKNA